MVFRYVQRARSGSITTEELTTQEQQIQQQIQQIRDQQNQATGNRFRQLKNQRQALGNQLNAINEARRILRDRQKAENRAKNTGRTVDQEIERERQSVSKSKLRQAPNQPALQTNQPQQFQVKIQGKTFVGTREFIRGKKSEFELTQRREIAEESNRKGVRARDFFPETNINKQKSNNNDEGVRIRNTGLDDNSPVSISKEVRKLEEREKAFSQRVNRLEKEEKEFFESKGIRRVEDTASLLTGGRGKRPEERGFIGGTSQRVVGGFLKAGVVLPKTATLIGGKIAATAEGLTIPSARKNIPSELGRTGKETPKIFNPTTQEGAATLITAAAFALPVAAARAGAIPRTTGPVGEIKVTRTARSPKVETTGTTSPKLKTTGTTVLEFTEATRAGKAVQTRVVQSDIGGTVKTQTIGKTKFTTIENPNLPRVKVVKQVGGTVRSVRTFKPTKSTGTFEIETLTKQRESISNQPTKSVIEEVQTSGETVAIRGKIGRQEFEGIGQRGTVTKSKAEAGKSRLTTRENIVQRETSTGAKNIIDSSISKRVPTEIRSGKTPTFETVRSRNILEKSKGLTVRDGQVFTEVKSTAQIAELGSIRLRTTASENFQAVLKPRKNVGSARILKKSREANAIQKRVQRPAQRKQSRTKSQKSIENEARSGQTTQLKQPKTQNTREIVRQTVESPKLPKTGRISLSERPFGRLAEATRTPRGVLGIRSRTNLSPRQTEGFSPQLKPPVQPQRTISVPKLRETPDVREVTTSTTRTTSRTSLLGFQSGKGSPLAPTTGQGSFRTGIRTPVLPPPINISRGGSRTGSTRKKNKKRGTRFTPDAFSLATLRFGSKPSKEVVKSGLTLRPIPLTAKELLR